MGEGKKKQRVVELEPSGPCKRLTEELSKDTKWWVLVSYQWQILFHLSWSLCINSVDCSKILFQDSNLGTVTECRMICRKFLVSEHCAHMRMIHGSCVLANIKATHTSASAYTTDTHRSPLIFKLCFFTLCIEHNCTQDAHKRLVLQVCLGSNTLEFSAIRS